MTEMKRKKLPFFIGQFKHHSNKQPFRCFGSELIVQLTQDKKEHLQSLSDLPISEL